ncbi:hypothetical protein CRI78_25405 [Mycolicibacterium diernhoferi]|uniref:Uncharacterized protein n=1 Tax=Mycolicibacterium diernhoferi TaxID=1801 RepID=A0A1T3WK21_9MYCO|nr:hypothetical protein BV510_09155 [Mycolicibacterium diernhoferi]PEG51690.1 hypothetical protein CRI78_25405 [Mycolicibacterium diernhoferi]
MNYGRARGCRRRFSPLKRRPFHLTRHRSSRRPGRALQDSTRRRHTRRTPRPPTRHGRAGHVGLGTRGRALTVTASKPGEPTRSDGRLIHVDGALPRAAPDGSDPHIRGQIFRSATSVPVLFDPA